ncbi:MAG TPA: chemotaxis protein CheW [Thermoanaerobaculia bacterium]|nr:chemotaxis protein CheW [Thermoanaerobaculia bacterium]
MPREIRLIAFLIGGEPFLLDIMAIRQIVPYSGSTPVPQAPDFIEGIIVLRNQVIPIIDLRSRLYPDRTWDAGQPLVLIVDTADGVMGIRVEDVRRILAIDLDAILPSPPIIRGLAGELFIGVIEHNDEIHLLIDLQAILTSDERESLREADLEGVALKGEG